MTWLVLLVTLLLSLHDWTGAVRAHESEEPDTRSEPIRKDVVSKPPVGPKPPVRQVMLRAMTLALEARGLTVAEGSIEQASFTTAYATLDAALIPMAIRRSAGYESAPVERVEYRHRITLAGRDAILMKVKTEIRIWPPPEPPASTAPGRPRPGIVPTSYLGHQMNLAFGRAVDSLSHLLPDELPDDAPATTGQKND